MLRARGLYSSAVVTLVVGLGLSACGGSSTSASTPSGPALSDSQNTAYTSADLGIFASANATANIVQHPESVRHAEQLLKPLIVAKTLQVDSSNQVAGGLISNLMTELDGTVPGLTTGTGSDAKLDGPTVHRLLVFGLKRPVKVFEPRVARGVSELERLLRGKPANLRVSLVGQKPTRTARQDLLQDVQLTKAYWPDLSKRLQKLNNSLS